MCVHVFVCTYVYDTDRERGKDGGRKGGIEGGREKKREKERGPIK